MKIFFVPQIVPKQDLEHLKKIDFGYDFENDLNHFFSQMILILIFKITDLSDFDFLFQNH